MLEKIKITGEKKRWFGNFKRKIEKWINRSIINLYVWKHVFEWVINTK
jgi:hypothetical protein